MSADCIYRVWVSTEGREVVIKGISCSTNCFPKPHANEMSEYHADEMWRKPIDQSALIEWVTSLCRGYDSGSVFEPGMKRDGSVAWKRWRTRLLRGAGVDIGTPPPCGELQYSDSIQSGLPLGNDSFEKRVFKKGDLISFELARQLLTDFYDCKIHVILVRPFDRQLEARLGFMREDSPDQVFAFRPGKSCRGYYADKDCHFVVRKTTTLTRVSNRAPVARPSIIPSISDLARNDLFAVLRGENEVFSREGFWTPARYCWKDISEVFPETYSVIRGGEDLWRCHVLAMVTEDEATKAVDYYKVYNPAADVRAVPVVEFSRIGLLSAITA